MIAAYVAVGFFIGTIVGVIMAALFTVSQRSGQSADWDRQALRKEGEDNGESDKSEVQG